LWEQRLARAQQTLSAYLESTKYPPESRPISEKPDLQTTSQPLANQLPFKKKNGAARGDLRMKTWQSSQRLIADEIVTMTFACISGKGYEPSEFISAQTVEVPPKGLAATAISFYDDGSHGDERGGDRVFSTQFQPSASPQFAGYNGYVNVPVTLRCGGDETTTFFDFFYTSGEPTRFTGKVREVVEKGSLALYLELLVKKAGNYKLAIRVDDAEGKSFAYVAFDGDLAAGMQEARFLLFGKLIKDQGAASPFKLRDLDGYLFLSDQNPDRENLKPTPGAFHTTQKYGAEAFSEAEWSSEEKDRHVAEFTKDVDNAKEKVAEEQSGKTPKEYPEAGVIVK